MAGLSHLPLFVGDFIASTASWSGEERGLYVQLLMVQWSAQVVPKSVTKCAELLHYDLRIYKRLWRTVSTKFIETEHGLINQRLEEHRSKALEIQRRNSERAQRAANSRWDTGHAPSNAPSIPAKMLQASSVDAPSMSGEHAIQSNPIKNKNLEGNGPVDNSPDAQRARQRDKRAGAAGNSASENPAHKAWVLLLASDGRIRPPAVQAALDAIPGGWPTLRMRTPATEPSIRAQFVAAYNSVHVKA